MFLALNTDMSCSLIKLDERADRSLGLSIKACTDFSSAAKLSAKIKKKNISLQLSYTGFQLPTDPTVK